MQMKWWRDNETHRPGLTQRTLLQLSPGSRSPRKTDRLSEAACCLNFWLQPSASLPVSFIFNDSVNLTPTFPSGVYMLVCVCVYGRECVCVCVRISSANGKRKQRKGDRSEPIQYVGLSCECPWPRSAFTSRTQCAAGIKMLCKVRTPPSTENTFTVAAERRWRRIPSESRRRIKNKCFESGEYIFFFFLLSAFYPKVGAERNLSGHVAKMFSFSFTFTSGNNGSNKKRKGGDWSHFLEHMKTNTSIIGNMNVMGGQEEEAHLCSLAHVSHLASPGHRCDRHNIIFIVILKKNKITTLTRALQQTF